MKINKFVTEINNFLTKNYQLLNKINKGNFEQIINKLGTQNQKINKLTNVLQKFKNIKFFHKNLQIFVTSNKFFRKT